MKNRLLFILALLLGAIQIWAMDSAVEQFSWKRPQVENWNEQTEIGFVSTTSAGLIYGGSPIDSIFRINKVGVSYRSELLGRLPLTIKMPAVVSTPKGVVIAGGLTFDGVSDKVYLIGIAINELQIDSLPKLPHPIVGAAISYYENRLIIAGGVVDGVKFATTWQLDLQNPNQGWSSLPDYPGRIVSHPTSAIQNNGVEDIFYLFGDDVVGFSFKQNNWQYITPAYDQNGVGLSNVAAEAVGTHHIIFPNVNGKSYVFHTVTRQFAHVGDASEKLESHQNSVTWDGRIWMVGDQLRTLEIRTAADFGNLNYIVLALYLLAMIGVGFYFSRKVSSADHFFKGGGQIPWWAAGISIFATSLSAITFMAIPAKTYTANWLYFPMSLSILIVAPMVIRWYLPFFRGLHLTSAYEYLERRFNRTVRLLSSFLFVLFMVTRIGIVLYLPSVALSTVTGIDLLVCIFLMSLVTIVYSTMGGVEAVIWGDVIQGGILVVGAFISAIYLIVGAGGFTETISIAQSADKFEMLNFTFDLKQPTFWVIFFGAGLANSLITYTSDQTIVQRYLTTSDMGKTRRSIWLNGLISLPVLILFYFIGTALFSFFHVHSEQLPITMSNAEGIFPFFIVNELPAGVAGLLIAAIFAATMSTLSSNINSASTALTVDFVKLLKPSISDRGEVTSARISGVVVCFLGTALAVILSAMSVKSFFDEFNTFIGLLTSGLGGLFAIGIFLPRVRGYAALCGLVGSVSLLLWMRVHSPVNFMLYGLIGILSSMVIAYCISYILPEKQKELRGLTWRSRKM